MAIIDKSFRLKNSFWHKFIPHSNQLVAPLNIKMDVWDLSTKKIETKFHPQVYCVEHGTFNDDGSMFLVVGGCVANQSIFKILKTQTWEVLAEFNIEEQATNAVFIHEDSFCFGTWNGHLYIYNWVEKRLEKLMSIPDAMIKQVVKHKDFIYLIISPLSYTNKANYILMYNLVSQKTNLLELPIAIDTNITSLAIHLQTWAILTTSYEAIIKDQLVHKAQLFIYSEKEDKLILYQDDFRVRDVFNKVDALSWSVHGLLSVIGLDKVYIIDIYNKTQEKTLAFDKASAVTFSPDGSALAVGGDKAKIFKLS